jgi:hypothetical protein
MKDCSKDPIGIGGAKKIKINKIDLFYLRLLKNMISLNILAVTIKLNCNIKSSTTKSTI